MNLRRALEDIARPKPCIFVFPMWKGNRLVVEEDPWTGRRFYGVSEDAYTWMENKLMLRRMERLHEYAEVVREPGISRLVLIQGPLRSAGVTYTGFSLPGTANISEEYRIRLTQPEFEVQR